MTAMGMMYGPMKTCQGEGCTNRMWASDPRVLCPTCQKKRDGTPEDPEEEQKQALFNGFLELGFTNGEAKRLADAWANPEQIGWWLEQGCSHRRAVLIAT